MRDVCDHYKRYKCEGWGRILIELRIGPESSYRVPFYDRRLSEQPLITCSLVASPT